MKPSFQAWEPLLYVFLILCWHSGANEASSINSTDESISGYGLEILLAKLDYLQYKLLEMSVAMSEQTEAIAQSQDQQDNVFRSLLWAISRLDQAVGHNLTTLQAHSWKVLSQQSACANHEQLRLEVSRIVSKMAPIAQSVVDLRANRRKGPFRSCGEEPTKVSGKYLLQATDDLEPFAAFCEQAKFGGGWLVIQHRFDGSVNFLRNWTDYRDGFGSVEREFWLGLERLHQLTSQRTYELLIELEDFAGQLTYIRYTQFEVGSEEEQYSLKQLGAFSGTAKDAMTDGKGMKFSTVDRDNDIWKEKNCAVIRSGAWWYKDCSAGNLNGLRVNTLDLANCHSMYFHVDCKGFAYSRMMIRQV